MDSLRPSVCPQQLRTVQRAHCKKKKLYKARKRNHNHNLSCSRTHLVQAFIIMISNSWKLSTPSPSRSNLRIMARQSSTSRRAPSLLSIRPRLAGVMRPSPSAAYMPNAASSPPRRRHSSSSPPPAASARTSRANSPSSSSPSPSASAEATSASASSGATSSPSAARMQSRSSAAEILPSASLSNAANSEPSSPDADGDATTSMLSIGPASLAEMPRREETEDLPSRTSLAFVLGRSDLASALVGSGSALRVLSHVAVVL
ncbi:hypothetical protein PVAP13_9KG317257 [Panicum virgatum]|uniref:Uncharacterized protein n=1 Tax=Panicum virgatum TaxID=38727 RepID=A0A8T0NN56_PANVG|nr:hypothetical protein PVAP13_9KG317257 [Panicum virgatum]